MSISTLRKSGTANRGQNRASKPCRENIITPKPAEENPEDVDIDTGDGKKLEEPVTINGLGRVMRRPKQCLQGRTCDCEIILPGRRDLAQIMAWQAGSGSGRR